MPKLTKFQDRKQATLATAQKKAEIHGESSFSFQYRKETVWVTARKDGNDSVTHVKNKGK